MYYILQNQYNKWLKEDFLAEQFCIVTNNADFVDKIELMKVESTFDEFKLQTIKVIIK